ncbi:EGF-like repeat and discoidin I-like domain-containing protein 3 [Oculina patagonica]
MEVLTQSKVVLFTLLLSFATVTDGQGEACFPNPCQHGGTCFPNQLSRNTRRTARMVSFDYTCNCLREFTGQNCSSRKYQRFLMV